MWFLRQRADALRKSIYRPAAECDRGGYCKGARWTALPMLRPHPHDSGAGALRRGGRMTGTSSRRDFLKDAGALIVGFSMGGGRLSAQKPTNPTGLVDATQ